MSRKIVILGLGPCGLGAAWRLEELAHSDFAVFEKSSYPGGLAASFTDTNGFTWDIGGHVQFSHYKYFDDVMDSLLAGEWMYHERESWVWIKEKFVPYPFQNNIRHLPQPEMWKCLCGIIELYNNNPNNNTKKNPSNFREWIVATFGEGLADLFFFPYNYKVWACPPEKMMYGWVGERVSVPDLKRIIGNIIFNKDDVSWGPNNTFRFPLRGGTGEIWRRLHQKILKEVSFNHEAVEVNTSGKYVRFNNGHKEHYDFLISTMPLDKLIMISDLKDKSAVPKLVHSSVHIFGVGLKGSPPEHIRKKCWIYFPENDCPFYRGTIFSNYSPNNVPDIKHYWSLMLEVSESSDKKVDLSSLKEDVIKGLINTKMIASSDDIVDFWHHFEEYGYPTPSIHRDDALKSLRDLDELGVFSRGRFGAWKYEVSNQDHTFMQGVEAVNRIILNKDEITVWDPETVNNGKN